MGIEFADRLGLARQQLALGRALTLPVSGSSMWPAVRSGQVVTVVPCGADLRVGDVVLLAGHDVVVLHRITRLTASAVLTKGDACPDADGWVPRAEVLGRLERRPWDRLLAWSAPWLGRLLVRAAAVRGA